MMTRKLNKLGFDAAGRARPLVVGASSLAIAGLLGACATPPAATATGPSPAAGPQAESGNGAVRVFASLKNAESAFADYARSLHRESELRKSVETASNAALVARHRQIVGAPDFLAANDADARLAAARRALREGEVATRVARGRLYRALGLEDSTAMLVNDAGSGGAVLPLRDGQAQPFAPDASL